MLRFKGSDCRRSQGLTWYGRMDILLMALRFIESKADSNLCFKVEGRRPVMLLLYVDELFLTEKRNSLKVARRRLAAKFEVKDLGMMHYILGMEVWTREACSRDLEEVQDDGIHDLTYCIELEAIECCFTRVD